MKYSTDVIKFSTFENMCWLTKNRVLDEKIDVTCEYECKDYGDWYQGVFMTDKFGGIAAIVKVVNQVEIYLNDERVFGLTAALRKVPDLVEETYKNRDMSNICDQINAEY